MASKASPFERGRSEGLLNLRLRQYDTGERVAPVDARSSKARDEGVRNAHFDTAGRLIGGDRINGTGKITPGGPDIFDRELGGLGTPARREREMWRAQFKPLSEQRDIRSGLDRDEAVKKEGDELYEAKRRADYRRSILGTESSKAISEVGGPGDGAASPGVRFAGMLRGWKAAEAGPAPVPKPEMVPLPSGSGIDPRVPTRSDTVADIFANRVRPTGLKPEFNASPENMPEPFAGVWRPGGRTVKLEAPRDVIGERLRNDATTRELARRRQQNKV